MAIKDSIKLKEILTTVSLARSMLEEMRDEGQAELDEKPEKYRESDKGEAEAGVLAELEEAITSLETCEDNLAGLII